jgi:hypothetical protein
MGQTTKTIKSYVNRFIAKLNGEDDKALGEKTKRQADLALCAKIALLKYEALELESNLAKAEENIENAILNNGKLIENSDEFIRLLVETESKKVMATNAILAHQKLIDFLNEKLTEVNAVEN